MADVQIKFRITGAQAATRQVRDVADALRDLNKAGAGADVSGAIGRSTREMGRARDAARDLARVGREGGQSLGESFFYATNNIQAAYAALKQVYDLARSGAQTIQQTSSFEALASQRGMDPTALLQRLREATRGTANDMALVTNASRAMALKVASDAETMANVFQLAEFKARQFGLTTEEALERIALGIGKGEPEILDELGILVKRADAYRAYADSIGVSVDALTAEQQILAVRNSIMEAGNAEMAAAGEQLDGINDRYARAEAAVANAAESGKKWLAVAADMVASPLAAAIGDLVGKFDALSQSIGGGKLSEVGTTINQLTSLLAGSAQGYAELFRQGKTLEVGTALLTGNFAELQRIMRDPAAMQAFQQGVIGAADNLDLLDTSTQQARISLGGLAGALSEAAEKARALAQEQAAGILELARPGPSNPLDRYREAVRGQESAARELAQGRQRLASDRAAAAAREASQAQAHQRRLADMARDHGRRLTEIARDTAERRAEAEEKFRERVASLVQRHQRDTEKRARDAEIKARDDAEEKRQEDLRAEEDYQRERNRIISDAAQSERDAIRNRDARALIEARERRAEALANLEEGRGTGQGRRDQDFRADQQKRAEALAREAAEREASYQEQLRDLETQKAAELAEIDKAAAKQRQRLAESYAQQRSDAVRAFNQQMADAAQAHRASEQETQRHLQSVVAMYRAAVLQRAELLRWAQQVEQSTMTSINVPLLGNIQVPGAPAAPDPRGGKARGGSSPNRGIPKQAAGGLVMADRATSVTFGEGGPEAALFIPLDKLMAGGGSGGRGAAPMGGQQITFAPQLSVQVQGGSGDPREVADLARQAAEEVTEQAFEQFLAGLSRTLGG
jgi:hypothetical protein